MACVLLLDVSTFVWSLCVKGTEDVLAHCRFMKESKLLHKVSGHYEHQLAKEAASTHNGHSRSQDVAGENSGAVVCSYLPAPVQVLDCVHSCRLLRVHACSLSATIRPCVKHHCLP